MCYTLPLITNGYIEPVSLMVCNQPIRTTSVVLLSIATLAVAAGLAWLWVYVTTPDVITSMEPTQAGPYLTRVPLPVARKIPKRKPIVLPIMPIRRSEVEIKGLAVSFQNAKKRIAEAREATGKFDTTVGAFVASLDDVTSQVDAMHSDLKFEAETLGNSSSQTNSGTAPVGAKPGETAHLPKVEGA